MKLKKIVSLALAGIMAVSMLTACGSNSTENGGASSEGNTATTGVSAALYDELSLTAQRNVTFSDSSKLDAALKEVVENYVSEADAVAAYRNGFAHDNTTLAAAWTKLADKLDAVENIGVNVYKADKTSTGVVIAVAGQGMSDQAILEETAEWIEDAVEGFIAESADGKYGYTYTASASIVEKSGVGAMGTNRTVKYIAVSVTRTVTEL